MEGFGHLLLVVFRISGVKKGFLCRQNTYLSCHRNHSASYYPIIHYPNATAMLSTNLLKSIFISFFPTLGLVVSGLTLMDLSKDFELATLGLFVMGMTVVTLFALIFLRQMARGYANLRGFAVVLGLGLLVLLIGYFQGNGSPGDLIWAALLILGWIGYTRWYSLFPDREKEVLIVGKMLPAFEVEDIDQNKITNQDLLGKKSLLLFFRGNWCPLCMVQLREVVSEYKELESLGVQTYLISPQPPSHSASLAKKHNVNFKYLVDTGNEMAKRFHIYAKNGLPMGLQALGYDSDTVLPTVLVSDEKGKIIFADLTDNYRRRPEPSTFLEIIRKH